MEVDSQFLQFAADDRRLAFKALLREPIAESRIWDWHDSRAVEVWVVARSEEDRLIFAYSEEGYGDRWGVLFDKEPKLLGMDAQWYLYLEDAFISSGAWKGSIPENFEIR